MPLILRKIRKARWHKYEASVFSWLGNDDMPADPLGDLATNNNTLSVWQIDDNKSNLLQVAVALAANCDDLSNLDYALLDLQFLADKITLQPSHGNSPHETANQNWHCDLVQLSALKLVALAEAIFKHAEIKRIAEKEILNLLAQAVASGQIERAKLSDKVRAKVDKVMALNKS